MSKIRPSQLDIYRLTLGLRTGMSAKQIVTNGAIVGLSGAMYVDDPYSTSRRPGETDAQLRERVKNWYRDMYSNLSRLGSDVKYLDGNYYPTEREKGLFGRVEKEFHGYGELRRQKKSPHTQVLYVWSKQGQSLVLRSINNSSNDQIQQAIQWAGLKLEDHTLPQADAEMILDMLYAELKARLDWTDRKRKLNARSKQHESDPALGG
jgi:hypothetical protein